MNKRFYRSRTDKLIAGVCGGIAEYFHVPSLVIRLIFLALGAGAGTGLIIYFLLSLGIPEAPQTDSKKD